MLSKALTIFDWSERSQVEQHSAPHNIFSNREVISIKEARKLLGKKSKNLTNEELEMLITDTVTVMRIAIRNYMRSKNSVFTDNIKSKES